MMFGNLHMPLNMDDVFNRETHGLSIDTGTAVVTEDAATKLNQQLTDRIRLSRLEKTSTRSLQFGEPIGR
jgi:hypothetical protein